MQQRDGCLSADCDRQFKLDDVLGAVFAGQSKRVHNADGCLSAKCIRQFKLDDVLVSNDILTPV